MREATSQITTSQLFWPPLCKLTNFQESFQFQGAKNRLLLQASVCLSDALHLHFGAPEGLVGPIPVLDEAAGYFQRHLE